MCGDKFTFDAETAVPCFSTLAMVINVPRVVHSKMVGSSHDPRSYDQGDVASRKTADENLPVDIGFPAATNKSRIHS